MSFVNNDLQFDIAPTELNPSKRGKVASYAWGQQEGDQRASTWIKGSRIMVPTYYMYPTS